MQRKRTKTDLVLAFYCSSNVPVRWFRLHGFVSSVRRLFGTQPNFRLSSYCPGYSSLTSFPLRVRLLTYLKNCRCRLLPQGVSGKNIRFRWFHTCAEDFRLFFLSFLITVVVHWLTYNQCLSLSHSEVSWPFP